MWESFNYYSGGGIQGVDGQRQTVLDEQVGLVSPRGRPSQPTLERPEIPLAWPAGEPSVTFEMQRKTHMYSRMAVPTLLHTCVEFRRTLIDLGYELAFGTRSAAPRIRSHY